MEKIQEKIRKNKLLIFIPIILIISGIFVLDLMGAMTNGRGPSGSGTKPVISISPSSTISEYITDSSYDFFIVATDADGDMTSVKLIYIRQNLDLGIDDRETIFEDTPNNGSVYSKIISIIIKESYMPRLAHVGGMEEVVPTLVSHKLQLEIRDASQYQAVDKFELPVKVGDPPETMTMPSTAPSFELPILLIGIIGACI